MSTFSNVLENENDNKSDASIATDELTDMYNSSDQVQKKTIKTTGLNTVEQTPMQTNVNFIFEEKRPQGI